GFNRAPADAGDSQQRSWLIYPAMFGIGFYGGFIQVGVGFLLMAALFHLLRLNLVHVNMHKVFIVLIYTIPALGVFIWSGNVDWLLGISLAAGNSFGGWWAAKLSVRKGDKIIRYVLFVAIILMALKLLDIF
ncbi:MAG: sulfite exporter TauE/SafE family protein, partial [Calditrichaeota bacterium]|nr:sulfite exporter TauE/SafE family protein [Calditrichota bacterium]